MRVLITPGAVNYIENYKGLCWASKEMDATRLCEHANTNFIGKDASFFKEPSPCLTSMKFTQYFPKHALSCADNPNTQQETKNCSIVSNKDQVTFVKSIQVDTVKMEDSCTSASSHRTGRSAKIPFLNRIVGASSSGLISPR